MGNIIKNIPKGVPGYFKSRKIKTGIAMVSGYLLVLLLFFSGIFIFADRGNLLTVAAILMMLPTGKMTVNFLMYPRKGKADRAEYDKMCEDYDKLTILADILITPEKKSIEFTYIKRTQVTDDLRASTHMDVRFVALADDLYYLYSQCLLFFSSVCWNIIIPQPHIIKCRPGQLFLFSISIRVH